MKYSIKKSIDILHYKYYTIPCNVKYLLLLLLLYNYV